ncbi:MAG TPA: amino acid adenylation domain-containing protein, partial [Thermoanaerobaculia bacterium]|nr:amino acid adenylation domain-containing protein [Thermoanaerobaculia bacterium]
MSSKASSLVDVLRLRAEERAERRAFTFLRDGELEWAHLSFGELESRARALAFHLQEMGAVGGRALLVFPPGLDFIVAFFGCLFAEVAAVPVYPPRLNQGFDRIRAVVADARPGFVLTTTSLSARLRSSQVREPALSGLRVMAIDALDPGEGASWKGHKIGSDTLAFLQYTSGSTGDPKGVMVSHGNLLHNEEMIRLAFRQSEDSVVVGWLPLYHDMGLIGNVIQPVYCGAHCVLMSPTAFLQRPLRWLEAISHYRATTSGGPDFSYELCVRKSEPEQRARLQLASWAVAFNGAETVRAQTLERFAAAFAVSGFRRDAFYPCYGLAEATLFVSGAAIGQAPAVQAFDRAALERGEAVPSPSEGDARVLLGCGEPWLGQTVAIVDPDTHHRRRSRQVGEVWVSGPSVAQGYWDRPDSTRSTFAARLAGPEISSAEGGLSFLRTGDLGFEHQGALFLCGRIKDLIIVRGRNHYAEDIEKTAQDSHPALAPAAGAALAVEHEGVEGLVIVHEVIRRADADLSTLGMAIRRSVASVHEIEPYEVVLVAQGTVPKTSSGKVRRGVCRDLYLAGGLDVLGRFASATAGSPISPGRFGSEVQQLPLAARLQAVTSFLQHEVGRLTGTEPDQVAPWRSPIELGLDSLHAVELGNAMQAELGLAIAISDLLATPTLASLAAEVLQRWSEGTSAAGLEGLEDGPPASAPGGEPTAPAGAAPTSYGQRSLWFLHRLAPESGAYHIGVATRLRSDLDREALRSAWQRLCERHATLRTIYHAEGDEVWQLPGPLASILEVDLSDLDEADLQSRLADKVSAPFDLATSSPVRFEIVAAAGDRTLLLFVVHHIAADLLSLSLLLEELGYLYAQGGAADLPAPSATYAGYAVWQRKLLASARGEAQFEYWRHELGGAGTDLELPTDLPRPAVQSYRGARRSARSQEEPLGNLRALCGGQGATLTVGLLAAYAVLLHRYSGQADLTIGVPAAGRSRPQFRSVFGYFVNPVTLRCRFEDGLTFAQLLRQLRDRTLAALANQDYPFSLLAQRLRPARDAGRSPLFQAMLVSYGAGPAADLGIFAMGQPDRVVDFGGLRLEALPLATRWVQVDLTLTALESEGVLALDYCTDLFEETTVERMLSHLLTLMTAGAAEPEQRIADLPLLSTAERAQLARWNQTEVRFGDPACLHTLVEGQVRRTPEAVAVVAGRECLTYEELDGRAERLASSLVLLGAGPGAVVAVCLERSLAAVVALLGVLKTGAAFLPLDPEYPRPRLAAMLEDTVVAAVLTQESLAEAIPATGAPLVLLERLAIEAGNPIPRPAIGVDPGDVAYVLFTSGSTGRPKGVPNTHRAIANRLLWGQLALPLTPEDRVLQKTPFSFDVSVSELFSPLIAGARLVVARPDGHLDPFYLAGLIQEREITTAHFVPSMLQVFLDEPASRGCRSLRRVICSGEALSPDLPPRFFAALEADLFNLYGPTEAAVEVTWWQCIRGAAATPVPIGRPIANAQIHVLDRGLQPVPVSVPGELAIGGLPVALGYLRRPELTAERFIPDGSGAAGAGARLYRTGDLARFQPDGRLDFLGRLDHQVKIRGRRIELGEIEAILAAHPVTREVVVVAPEDARGRRLVAYVVREPGAEESRAEAERELRSALEERLPSYMMPSAFVWLSELPRSPNGKIDRHQLPAPAAPSHSGHAPATVVEELLAGIWCESLGLSGVGLDDDFFALGGHSLLATRVTSRVRAACGVDLPVRTLFELPTVARLAARIAIEMESGPARARRSAIPRRADGTAAPPLSFAQERLWFLEQLTPGTPTYNMPLALRLAGELDVAALGHALDDVVGRHGALRTAFVSFGDRPAQLISPAAVLPIAHVDAERLPAAEREREVRRLVKALATLPFALHRAPLLRAALIRLAPAEHVLLLTAHHMVADGWSFGVLVSELTAGYAARRGNASPAPLPELPIEYADFAVWQRERLERGELESEREYWRARLAGAPPASRLPGDCARDGAESALGSSRLSAISAGTVRQLRSLARRHEVTLFMVLTAAFKTLLLRHSGQTDLVIGVPIAGRTRLETEGLVGLFVNTLALRTDLAGEPAFAELLTRVRTGALEAYAHQELPFEQVVELAAERSLDHPPLVQILLALQNLQLPTLTIQGLVVNRMEVESASARFDLSVACEELPDGGLEVWWEYRRRLFSRHAVQRLAGHWERLLESALAAPQARLAELALLSPAERWQLVAEWNASGLTLGPAAGGEGERLEGRFWSLASR